MQRYRFGKGEYNISTIHYHNRFQQVRESFYPPLAMLANEWMKRLGIGTTFPLYHEKLIRQCHDKEQKRPTPLILRYEAGGYNTLHQDLYGEIYFPFQVVFVLSEEGRDYDGGEFVLIEQLPRAQSKAEVIHLKIGDALIFTTNFRPVRGTRGYYRAKIKHGVSPLKSGVRFALGSFFMTQLGTRNRQGMQMRCIK
ncbi:MAG: 2OG-Fe(II) oxygenase [Bacteroidota bacterium]